ncbi:MAG: hypothetical protein HXS46_14825 [Theionarchaea archaeon]|nr:hypothetical protein [Theionarchaea archaeon]
MNQIEVRKEDEYQHTPIDDPLFWENYHFNAFDPVHNIGITTYTAIKPGPAMREEIIAVYPEPFFFCNQTPLQKDVLKSGSLRMEPVEPLKKWNISMNDAFQTVKNDILSDNVKEIEFDLLFESDIPPFGYSTHRGDRYEQPGSLKGNITIEGRTLQFNGRGIRDHSWEIRFVPDWGEWYGLMGCFESGFLTCAYMDMGGQNVCQGWMRTDHYTEIKAVGLHPVFSGNLLKKCHIDIETAERTLELNTQLISYVLLSMGEEQERSKVTETLVTFDEGGHGFLWYGGDL